MNNRQERLCRAAESGVTSARQLKPDQPRVTAAAQRLEAAVEAALTASGKQLAARDSRAMPENAAKRAKTLLFQKHLVPIATDGLELLAGVEDVEAVRTALKLPWLKAPAADHLLAAQRVRDVASRYERMFVGSRDYEPDFLVQLDRAVSDLHRAASEGNAAARADYSAATREVKEAVDEVQRCFDALDARVKEACFGDRAALREWRKRSRIPAKVGRPKKRKGKQKPTDEPGSDEKPRENP